MLKDQYVHSTYREITYFYSYYFKSVSLLGNTNFRNDPRRDSDNEVQYTLSILNICGRPSRSSKDHWLTDKEYFGMPMFTFSLTTMRLNTYSSKFNSPTKILSKLS